MTRSHGLRVLVIICTFLAIGTSFTLNQITIRETLTHLRAGCLRSSARNSVLVNVWRSQALASHIVATDPKQSARSRHARAREVQEILRGIRIFDQQIDPTSNLLTWRNDREQARAAGLTCAKAFPNSSPLPLTGALLPAPTTPMLALP